MTDSICHAEDCENTLEPSTGPTPRRWCSDRCRQRQARRDRAAPLVAEIAASPPGGVVAGVQAFVDELALQDAPFSGALASLALAQARSADEGNTNAQSSLLKTLGELAASADYVEESTETFTMVDIIQAYSREGIDPRSRIGQALLKRGRGRMVERHQPPAYPPGWRGTHADGDPATWALEHGGEFPEPAPLEWWPPQPPSGYTRNELEHVDPPEDRVGGVYDATPRGRVSPRRANAT